MHDNYSIEPNIKEIANNKEKEVKEMLEYCDLKWNKNCMQSYKFIHSMSTGTNSINIHQPMYQSSIQYWKKYKEQLKPPIEIVKI